MKVPGGGSDHQSFLVYMAIPVVDFLYTNNSGTQYPLYHSMYETPFVNEHLFDTDNFAVHRAVGQYWAELARSFADANILPFNTTIFAQKLLDDASNQLSRLISKANEFLRRAEKFDAMIYKQNQDGFGSLESRRVVPGLNRRLKAVDRCFLNPRY
uniref:Transferrin receptor-like dimerisation domain-containing protein n=1 Tax=Ditylenchus dipsaci TaxID=166011 RepID=A0A915CL20_9BILA